MSTAHARSDFCKAHANIREHAHECARALIHGPARMSKARLPAPRTARVLDAREQLVAALLRVFIALHAPEIAPVINGDVCGRPLVAYQAMTGNRLEHGKKLDSTMRLVNGDETRRRYSSIVRPSCTGFRP
ncbi:hypothetical protein [Caballeronia sp. J97]|uniref:hypothetical protein n=1 Tax=Caballeronia sp. J97 TaxID=2805429 RepID=UPI002AB05649|nr:hypothetical protein [Caballeronia sp. J97]